MPLKRLSLFVAGVLWLFAPHLAVAQDNSVTCTGTLVDLTLKPGEWPMGLIYDAAGRYTCIIDRGDAAQDRLRRCAAGHRCRLVGTYEKKTGTSFSIDRIISAEKLPDQNAK